MVTAGMAGVLSLEHHGRSIPAHVGAEHSAGGALPDDHLVAVRIEDPGDAFAPGLIGWLLGDRDAARAKTRDRGVAVICIDPEADRSRAWIRSEVSGEPDPQCDCPMSRPAYTTAPSGPGNSYETVAPRRSR
jgi:hypothetical protein